MSWITFVNHFGIPYKKSSGNNIAICCCLCFDDFNFNMGLSTVSPAFNCWRAQDHRGRKPHRVIQALLKCTYEQADIYAKTFLDWKSVSATPISEQKERKKVLTKPEDFLKFTGKEYEKPFLRYLEKRGLDKSVIERYQFEYCLTGYFAQRIIMPVISENKWQTWTARAISNTVNPRYITASSEKYNANDPHDYLYDEDHIHQGEKLIVCEGIFDSIAIDQSFICGVKGTAIFGKQLSDIQLKKLIELAPKFKQIVIALDKDAVKDSAAIVSRLKWYVTNICNLIPTDAKDWSEMGVDKIKCILNQ